MNEEQIKQIAQDIVEKNLGLSQFSVSQNSFHTHNGIDSPTIQYSNIKNKIHLFSYTLAGTAPATSGNYSSFFIAPFPMKINGIAEVHTTAGSDVGAVTLQVEKLTSTAAPGSGISVLSASFNLKGTANTVQNGVLSNTSNNLILNQGDRLGLVLTGTPTSVANMTITINLLA